MSLEYQQDRGHACRRSARSQARVVGGDARRPAGRQGGLVTVRGVLQVHSAPPALSPHIEWAVAGIFGVRGRLAWIEQPAAPGSVRTELDGQGRPGLSGEIASARAAWNLLRFEVTEEASAGCDAVRYSCTPALGMFTASMGANGDIMISENRLRAALTLAASGADSDRLGAIRELHGPQHPALGGSLEAPLSPLPRAARDPALRPLPHPPAGPPPHSPRDWPVYRGGSPTGPGRGPAGRARRGPERDQRGGGSRGPPEKRRRPAARVDSASPGPGGRGPACQAARAAGCRAPSG